MANAHPDRAAHRPSGAVAVLGPRAPRARTAAPAGGPGPVWPVRGPLRACVLVLAFGFAGALALAGTVPIHGAVIAPGNVGVATRLQAVQHPDGGLVAALRVRDGERVAAGAAILELDASELSSEEAVVTRQLHEARARIDRLSAEARSQDALAFRDGRAAMDSPVLAALLAAELRLFETGRETLIKTLGQIGERKTQTAAYIDGLQRQIEAVGDQLELIGAEARDKQSLLDRKLIKRSEVSRLRREEARLKGDLGRLQADVARARSAIASYEMERLRLLAERREKAQGQMRELQPREAELAERLRVIERRLSRRVLRAPMAGVVHALKAFTVGGVIPAGAEVAAIVPEGVSLVLDVRVDAGQIDEVWTGQDVSVIFPAFNVRTAPQFAGRVDTVSADALVDEATGARYYSVQVALDAASLARARTHGIVPGMPVEAFIRTRARTPLAFLLRPLTDYVRHAFREE